MKSFRRKADMAVCRLLLVTQKLYWIPNIY